MKHFFYLILKCTHRIHIKFVERILSFGERKRSSKKLNNFDMLRECLKSIFRQDFLFYWITITRNIR